MLQLIYFDPLGYLVPHAVRTFTNSLAWQRRMFGWMPSEPTTIVLNDFADFGNARAGVGAAQQARSSTSHRRRTRSRPSRPPSACTS